MKKKKIIFYFIIISFFIVNFLNGCLSTDDNFDSESVNIMIDTIGSFTFNPNDIDSIRNDIFIEDSFSVFDILVH